MYIVHGCIYRKSGQKIHNQTNGERTKKTLKFQMPLDGIHHFCVLFSRHTCRKRERERETDTNIKCTCYSQSVRTSTYHIINISKEYNALTQETNFRCSNSFLLRLRCPLAFVILLCTHGHVIKEGKNKRGEPSAEIPALAFDRHEYFLILHVATDLTHCAHQQNHHKIFAVRSFPFHHLMARHSFGRLPRTIMRTTAITKKNWEKFYVHFTHKKQNTKTRATNNGICCICWSGMRCDQTGY